MTIELKDLIEDIRLARLFAMPGRACALQIWILQVQGYDYLENRFVYARLLPYSFSSGGWSASSDDKFEVVGDCRAQVIRATLYIDSDQAVEMLSSFVKGDDVKKVSSSLGLNLPDFLEKRIGAFSLPSRYVFRPVALLMNRDAHGHAGSQSPHGSASAFSAAITFVDKEQLFLTAQGLDQEMARFIVKRMNAETGLDFAVKDAARLGDLELLVFPTLDDDERELLDVQWVGGETLLIKLNLFQLPGFSKFFVQAQIMNGGQRIFSSINSVEKGEMDVIECIFELPKGYWDIADSVEVEIHGVSSGEVAATLLCSWKNYYIREISISGHAVGGSNPEVKLGWLDKALKKKLKGSPRVRAAQTVSRNDIGFASVVGGRQADPWVVTNRKISELLGVLHPPKSDARFFGRLSEGDGTERLQFVEWIKQQFAKHRDHQIIFFDPYFEDAGIGLFFPNASNSGEYIVFTTVLPTTPSAQPLKGAARDEADRSRIDNLLASCEQLLAFAHRIDLKIYGVKAGALHDRYMLIADRRGLPVSGFNLSNSIQKANEDHPLLVTPIPMDALHEVFKYANRLISTAVNGANDDGEYIAPIFDSKRHEQPSRKRIDQLDFLRWDLTGTVLSSWTGEDSLREMQGEQLRDRLEELGLLEGDSLRIPNTPDVAKCIDTLLKGEYASDQIWAVVAEILARTPHGESLFVHAQKSSFFNFLEGVLKRAFSRFSDVARDTSFDSVQPQLFQQELESFLRGSYSYEQFRHRIKYDVLTWSDVYAVKILWESAPEKLIKLSEYCAASLDSEDHHRDAIKLSLLSQIVGEVSLTIALGISTAQRECLLRSTNGLFNWMGLASLKEECIDEKGASLVVVRLASFDQQPSIRLMCWLLSGLKWKQGSGGVVNIVRQALYNALPPILDKDEADFLVNSLRGHMRELAWSEPWLFSEVIVPLLDDDRVTPEALCSTWMKELFSYLDEKLLGKTVSFNRSREGRITEIAAFLLARSSPQTQGSVTEALLKTLKKAQKNVKQPLASTMNWNKWNCSLEVSMWIHAFCRYVENFTEETTKLPVEFVDLCKSSRDIAMVRTLDEWRYNGVERGALAAFIEEVGDI
jgi:hypothetical protein